MALTGFFILATMSSTNVIIQSEVDDRYRERVMRLYTLALIGSGPAGSLFAGWLADAVGVAASLATNSALLVLSALSVGFAAPERMGQGQKEICTLDAKQGPLTAEGK